MRSMRINEDQKLHFPFPFLKDKTVLYMDSRIGKSHSYIEDFYEEILSRIKKTGGTFLFLPDLVEHLTPDMLSYMFPGQKDIVFAEDMYQRIQELAGINDKTGFLYRDDDDLIFRELPEGPQEELESAVDAFIASRKEYRLCEPDGIRFRRDIPDKNEEPLAPKTQAIIEAWEKIECEFGVTPRDVEILLGYRTKLSRLHITASGAILLPDFGGKEVKIDNLTKAVYFYYLRHPEGACQKELQAHEEEILRYYLAISGRDDLNMIRKSLHKHLDPYGNSLNVSISRIKKAFKDIIGDHIARFYYIDGHYAEARKVALDRDYLIWDL